MSKATQAILMQCILERPGGTRVALGDAEYHFKPDGDGRHVAIVSDPDHVETLTAIPEAYKAIARIKAPEATQAQVPPPATPPAPLLAASEPVELKEPASAVVTGQHQAPEPIDVAPAAPDDKPSDTADEPNDDLNALDDDQIRSVFELELGRKANGRAGRDTLVHQIRTARQEKGAA